jgi:hypothetical protein
MAKKQSRRDKRKYAALDPQFNLKIRQELIDYDYVEKLSDEEKDWLNRFTEEYVGANLNHKGKRLHKTKKLVKDCYDRNNARNRDILSRSVAGGKLEYIEDLVTRDESESED